MLAYVSDRESHLQLIQATITRLAGQSTTIKGWCVTLTSALLGLGATTSTALLPGLAVYAVLVFALLDGYYLALERAYRTLYDSVRQRTDTDWSMAVPAPSVGGIASALRSWSILPLYASSLAVALTVAGYVYRK